MLLARLGGVALALGLFASATATAAGTGALYQVEPANPLAARALAEEDEESPSVADHEDGELQRRRRAREAAVTTILGHNPFCDDCPPPPTETTPGAPPPAALATTTPPAVQILATMESTNPEHSLATVYDPLRGTWAAGLGDALGPGVVLAAIGPGHITYARGAATGVLQVGAPAEAPAPPKARPRKPTGASSSNPPSALAGRVKCDAGSHCTIERSVIQEVLSNPSKLGGLRAFPSSGGFKLAGVRRGTLAHELGLRNGDVLTEVGGKPLDSIDDALALLPLLRSASNVHVTLSRKGKPITHEIEIV